MASVSTKSYEGRYLKLTVTQTKGTSEQNYSTINWKLESIGGSSTYYTIYNYGVWIDGVQRYDGTSGTKTKYWDSKKFPAAKGSVSGSFIKRHNADGSVGNVRFTLKGSVSANKTNSYDGVLTMESIARYFSSKPTIEIVSRNETQATIKWTTPETCSSVQYKLDNGSWVDVVSDANATSGQYTIDNLTPGKIYTLYGDFKRKDSGLWAPDKPYISLSMYDYPKPISMNNFIIGNGASIDLYNPLSRNVTLQILQESTNAVLGTYNGTSSGIINSEFKTADAIAKQYASIPTSKSGTYYCKVIYGDITRTLNDVNNHTYSITRNDAEKPLFDNSYVIDVLNNLHTDISGTDKFISGHNSLSGVIKPMVPQKSAEADYYSISTSGLETVTKTYSEANQSFNLGNMVSNTFNVTAIDKRGMSRTVTTNINLIPYNRPGVTTAKITRQNGVGTKAVIVFTGVYTNWSGLLKNNVIKSIKYKIGHDGTWKNLPSSATINNSDGIWTLNAILDDTFETASQYDLYLQITDLLETVEFGSYTISTADAFIWKDLANKRVGINKKPDYTLDVQGDIKTNNTLRGNELRVNGTGYSHGIEVGTNGVVSSGDIKTYNTLRGNELRVDGTGYSNGIEVGTNGVVSSGDIKTNGKNIVLSTTDSSTNDSGDILYTYGNGSEKSKIWMDDEISSENSRPNYRSFDSNGNQVVNDKLALLNDVFAANNILWGPEYFYMHENQDINLKQKVSEQKTGIILVWQAYDNGEVKHYDFNYTFIPKQHILIYEGAGIACWLTNSSGNQIASKYVYVYNNHIKGNALNNDGPTNRSGSGITTNSRLWVLTYVLGV